jgi:hypothetical protein
MAFGRGFECFEVQKMPQRGSYPVKKLFFWLILGAHHFACKYCSYTIYWRSLLEIERPDYNKWKIKKRK